MVVIINNNLKKKKKKTSKSNNRKKKENKLMTRDGPIMVGIGKRANGLAVELSAR